MESFAMHRRSRVYTTNGDPIRKRRFVAVGVIESTPNSKPDRGRELRQRLTDTSLPQSITPYSRCALVVLLEAVVLFGVDCKNADPGGESIGSIQILSTSGITTTPYQPLPEKQTGSGFSATKISIWER